MIRMETLWVQNENLRCHRFAQRMERGRSGIKRKRQQASTYLRQGSACGEKH